MSKSKNLGRGLASLIPNLDTENILNSESISKQRIEKLPIGEIMVNPSQPRKFFKDESISELATSIKESGILQPILVRPKNGRYEIVAGERRFRAAKLAGEAEIPAIIRDLEDEAVLQIALIENLQREDLNPMEEAKAYALLHQVYKLTHEEIAQKIGKKRVTITNRLRLLGLCEAVQKLIIEKKISEGHARCLIALKSDREQLKWAQKISTFDLSVRQTEALLARQAREYSDVAKGHNQNPEVTALQDRLAKRLGTKVEIQVKSQTTGKIVIDYYSLDDLDRIIKSLH
jgi:ParB family chromosome partitioning protein